MKIFCSDWPYLIRNHLSFCFCGFFFSQIFTLKLHLRPDIRLAYAISMMKVFLFFFFCFFFLFFLESLEKKICFMFLCWFLIMYVSWQYCDFSFKWKRNGTWPRITYLTDDFWIASSGRMSTHKIRFYKAKQENRVRIVKWANEVLCWSLFKVCPY